MMNPSAILDLARERRRELLEDASRSRQRTSRADEPEAADETFLAGRSAHVIGAHVRAEARRSFRVSANFDVPVGAR
jgi:hypothetical protein